MWARQANGALITPAGKIVVKAFRVPPNLFTRSQNVAAWHAKRPSDSRPSLHSRQSREIGAFYGIFI